MASWILEMQEDFSKENLITLNTSDDSFEKQLAINSLEEKTNPYRAIFAVDKLNEGWDVLNLFDIVRLYGTPKNESGKPAQTTIAEAQLIGRGARYYPFRIEKKQSLYKRKFDRDLQNELRVCEELYYHSPYDPSYINELNKVLISTGIKSAADEKVASQIKEKVLPSKLTSLPKELFNKIYKPEISSNTIDQKIPFIEIGERVIRKAIDKNNFYRFDHIKEIFPECNSIREFINSKKYLGNINIEIASENKNEENPYLLLSIAQNILMQIASDLKIYTLR